MRVCSLCLMLVFMLGFLAACSHETSVEDQVDSMLNVAREARDQGSLESSFHIVRQAARLAPREVAPMIARGEPASSTSRSASRASLNTSSDPSDPSLLMPPVTR